ncbi:MAG TPA: family 10 glycosylhydrolase, partial [bacterium]|nr:family 10 glycosylhydrolase [bacterium]
MSQQKRTIITLAVLALTLLGSISASAAEFRGMWVTRFEWPNSNQTTAKAKIDTIMTNLKDHGFNAVLFQMRGQGDVLYPSPYEPWSALLGGLGQNPGWDPMQYAINSAHSRGLEFHVYINTHVVWSSSSQTPPAHTTPEHPYWLYYNPSGNHDWTICDSAGTPVYYSSDNYCWCAPGVPSFQEWIRKVTMHVVNTYDVDGIHYDRIRVPANTYSYDPISNARRAGSGNPHSLDFKNWTRDQITRMLTDIYGSVMEVKPWVTMSCSPFGIYDRSRFAGYSGFTDGYDRWLQESQHWLEVGCMDAVVPMIYWDIPDPAPNFDILVQDWIDYRYGRHVYAGASAANYTFPELGNEITQTRTRGGQGFV